jgi:hypothetical protein
MEHTLVSPATGEYEYVGHVPVGQLTGTGTFRCAENGAVYTGEYEGNRFHGIGEMTYANGQVYRGQWKGGKREGDGTLTYVSTGFFTAGMKKTKVGRWMGDKEILSVPFDAANPAHAALLGAATAAEARRRAASAWAPSARVSTVRCRHGRAPPRPGQKLPGCATCTLRAVGLSLARALSCDHMNDWHRQASADEASRGAKAAEAKAEVRGMHSGARVPDRP